MRRTRFGISLVLAMVVFALVLPASASAAFPYTTTVERNRCEVTGGLYGGGFARLKVLQQEWGVSGTNYFKVRIQVQQRPRFSTTWSVLHTMTNISESFPNNSDNWWWEQNRRYDFTVSQAIDYGHRIAMRLQWWDMRAGADVLLSQKTVYSNSC